MKKRLLLFICIALPLVCIKSQQTSQSDKSALKTTWVSNGVRDNWFISLNGGIADLMSEEGWQMKFFDRVTPTIGLSVGKWISPVWGLRMNATSSKLQGFVSWNYADDSGDGLWYLGKNYDIPSGNTNLYADAATNGTFVRERFLKDKATSKYGVDGYTYNVTYAGISIDYLLNLKNFCMQYNENGLFNPIAYVGVGYSHTFKELDRTAVNVAMAKCGLMFDFRLSDAWSVNLDAQYIIVPEALDRRIGDNNIQDAIGNYTLGFTYKFKQRNFHVAELNDPKQIAALNNEINNLRKKLADRPSFKCPECPACPECPKLPPVVEVDKLKTPVEKYNVKFLPTPVYFRINSSVIDYNQWESIKKAAEYLRENPSQRIKISGYADRKTGTAAINKRLSEQRAKVVYDAMVNEYGISPSRIETAYLGDSVQPFEENDWNRVVIFVIP